MTNPKNSIDKTTHCPNCGVDIDVNELLYKQLDSQLREEYQTKLSAEQAQLEKQHSSIKQQQKELKQAIEQQVEKSLIDERSTLKAKLEREQAERLKSMQQELDEQSKKVVALNKAQSEIERLKREQQSMRSEIELDIEKKYTHQLTQQSNKIKQQADSNAELKIAEKEQVIDQLKRQLGDAQRQAEQGSTQLQGEVQELAIENWLSNRFPLDQIEEVKKGALGADTLQTINTLSREACGSIYYESKRTKNFQPQWVAKFKTDIQNKNADVGVLVTQTMPEGMDSLGQIDGVWVCTFEEFKNLAQVLRQSIIQIDQAVVVQENKGDKMGMLYDYLTGSEFRMQIEAIVEGFTQLKSDLESEKRSMQGIWKKREKQIERVLLNTNFMYNSVKGIAGNAVQSIALLELNGGEESEDS